MPPESIPTLGTRLLLVARRDVASATRSAASSESSTTPRSPRPSDRRSTPSCWNSRRNCPGTTVRPSIVRRSSPLIAGDAIDLLEKEVSILGVVLGGVFCLVQWLRRRYRWRRERGFEAYILQVADVERRALAVSRAPTLDLPALLQLQEDLTRIKGEALRRFADGELDGEELMSGFLAHVSDARDFLMRLILHQRELLEKQARLEGRGRRTSCATRSTASSRSPSRRIRLLVGSAIADDPP